MNYRVLIENRKSVRAFTDREVPFAEREKLKNFYKGSLRRLVPELETQLYFFGTSTREALEGAAGYHQFLIGAPQYMVLLSAPGALAAENGGFIMEELVLKATDLGLDSCWVTFTDSEAVKDALGIDSELNVTAIVAFGYGEKTTRRLRLNIQSMSNVDIVAKRRYAEPKRSIKDMAFLNSWGETRGLDDQIGFYDDVLWEALHAASLAPSYLNRQAYGFLFHDGQVSLIRRPDEYTTEHDGKLSLGIVLHHFTVVAEEWMGKLNWRFDNRESVPELPEGHEIVASCKL